VGLDLAGKNHVPDAEGDDLHTEAGHASAHDALHHAVVAASDLHRFRVKASP